MKEKIIGFITEPAIIEALAIGVILLIGKIDKSNTIAKIISKIGEKLTTE